MGYNLFYTLTFGEMREIWLSSHFVDIAALYEDF